jgi:hypothetical protein
VADLIRTSLQAAFARASEAARARRGRLLQRELSPRRDWTVLDLGSSDGRHVHTVLPESAHVVLADVDAKAGSRGAAEYGYEFVALPQSGRLPFGDGEFDLVFCSSVIEHVTGPKDSVVGLPDGRAFAYLAALHQQLFADEIRRVSKAYFVQTPYRYFPVDSHTWLPAPIALLPRRVLFVLLRVSNSRWIKSTAPDWHLLSHRRMAQLFPDARIVTERFLGIPKSLVAIHLFEDPLGR